MVLLLPQLAEIHSRSHWVPAELSHAIEAAVCTGKGCNPHGVCRSCSLIKFMLITITHHIAQQITRNEVDLYSPILTDHMMVMTIVSC